MKHYIVNVWVFSQCIKKYVVSQLEIAEMLADNIRDDITDVVIREVTY